MSAWTKVETDGITVWTRDGVLPERVQGLPGRRVSFQVVQGERTRDDGTSMDLWSSRIWSEPARDLMACAVFTSEAEALAWPEVGVTAILDAEAAGVQVPWSLVTTSPEPQEPGPSIYDVFAAGFRAGEAMNAELRDAFLAWVERMVAAGKPPPTWGEQ